jgi:Polyketide cyclase / dehydrase and lipid transport
VCVIKHPHYRFTTRWQVAATPNEVADVLGDPLDLPRWWPAVYLSAIEERPSGAGGLGQRVRLHTRGWLPYTLRWQLDVVRSDYPRGFAISATGDLSGSGVWTFTEHDGGTLVTFEWNVNAAKPLLRVLSPIFKPIFAANHRWAMRTGLASLERELARRRVRLRSSSSGESV